jgi:hypothetical protein
MMEQYDIYFDKSNINLLIIKENGRIITTMAIPPIINGIDIIHLNKNNGLMYQYNFDGFIVISNEEERILYYKGKIITRINRK